MNIEDLEKDLTLLKSKAPNSFNEIVRIGIPLIMLHTKFIEVGDNVLKEKYNLSRSELDVLSSLYFSGGDEFTLSPTSLYDRLLFSSGGMTKVLKKLEDKKLVSRLENPNDKRSKLVKLNEEKKELVPKVIKDIFASEEKCLSNLNEIEKKDLEKLLIKALN